MSTQDRPGKQRRVAPGKPKRSGTEHGPQPKPAESPGGKRPQPKIGSGWVEPGKVRPVTWGR